MTPLSSDSAGEPDILDAIENAAHEAGDLWPWTMTVGPVHSTGVEPVGGQWRWFVYDADGAGVSAYEPTKDKAAAAAAAEIAVWWNT